MEGTYVDCAKLSELKVMERLKILICQHLRNDDENPAPAIHWLRYEEILSLRQQLPHVQIDSLDERRANSKKNDLFYRFDKVASIFNYRI